MILTSIIVLAVIGLLSAVILYVLLQKFKVEEDPRIDKVQEVLPGANCGGCGSAGCRNFAERCVNATSLEGLNCPVGGSDTMKKVGEILGLKAEESVPMVAVVKCQTVCNDRPVSNTYDGVRTCRISQSLYSGESTCPYSCLGYGDCVAACQFGAISISPETGSVVVNADKCTGCASCVKACPKGIIELRKKWPKNRQVYVKCVNKDKGGVARKDCDNACIGCTKCAKECPFEAITIENNLAHIDTMKCRLCRKCVSVCPTGAIVAENFPQPLKPQPQNPEVQKPESTKPAVKEDAKA